MTRAPRPWDRPALRRAASRILAEGLRAAEPAALVARHVRASGQSILVAGKAYSVAHGRVLVVAAGKAAPAMARAAEERLGRKVSRALAVGVAGTPFGRTELLLAGHPIPDARGVAAAEAVLSLVRGLDPADLVLVLLSGGASALLPAPVPGVSLDDKAGVTTLLLRSGATIQELNTVRKHLSRLKGGGLARAAAPARVACLVLSDVVGDDLSTIASGPTAPDPTRFEDALSVLRTRGLLDAAPLSVRRHLEAGARGEVEETPKPGGRLFRRVTTRILGSTRLSVEAAAREARRLGLRTRILTTRLEGEAREASRVLVAVLRECVTSGRPAPVCLLAGGETTVTVTGDGRGGRNQEMAVAAVEPLASFQGPALVASFATDGIDGMSVAAGGVVDDRTSSRAAALGLAPPAAFLAQNDSESFLAPLGDLIVTGPTGTNVMDLTVLLGVPARRGP